MEEIVQEIANRRAFRALKTDSVPREVIDRIIEAGSMAPSCMNNQPWRFLVQSDPETLDQVKEHLSGGNYWAKSSPFIVAICTRHDFDCKLNAGRDYAFFDTGMAVGNMLTQGVREGLYTHPIAGFNPEGVKKVLDIPDEVILLTLIVFGYPGEASTLSEKHREMETSARVRKKPEEYTAFGRWPDSWDSE